MPAVRTRSRRVKGPGDLENETTQAKETNNCTHAADTSSMKSASDSGVDLCQDDETRLAAAEREPLKRKQQQQPKDCGETESKKRRVNRKSTQQQPSVSEVPNEGEAGSSRLSDEVAVAEEPPARADHKTESATETRDRKKAQPESQERRESSSKARGTRETTPDVVVVKWPKKRRGESCARRFIRAPRAQASSPIEIPDDEDVAGQASSIASGRRRREPRAARDVIVLESPEGRRRKPSAKPGKSRSRPKATSPIEIPDDEKVADQPSSLASGRPRRSTRAAKVSTVEKTKIPKGDSDEESDLESETDFSDNDDEDFVLPKSDHSDDDIPEEASEEDIVPEAVSEDEDERRPGLKKPSTVGRGKKIKRFLDDIEQPRSIKNTIIVNPSSESAEVEINIPVKKPIKPISQRTPKAGTSSRGKSKSMLDDDEEVVTEKKPSTSKARAVTTKKRLLSSSEDSDAAPKKTKAVKKVKTVSSATGKKTFMKPRRAPKPKTKESRSSLGSSRFEMSLLKLAKQMDDSDDSEDESQYSSQAASEVKTEEIPVEDVKQEPENDADKKRLIMSMLKEHEEVDEMSDDDSDEDAVAGRTPAPKVKSEVDPGNAASCSGTRPKNIEDGPIKESEESSVKTEAKRNKMGTKKSKKAAEKATQKKAKSKKGGAAEIVKEEEESSGSDDENWEVVEDRDPNYQRPENVTVVLQNEDFLPETKRLSMEQRMIRLINRKRKTSYLLCHRVHLMSLVGHHRILNSIADDDYVKAYALSRLPHPIALPGKRQKASEIIKQLLLFYKSSFELNSSDDVFDPKLLKANLIKLLAKKVTSCNIVYLFGLLVLLRASGIRTRLCLSYHLLPLKAPLLRVKDGEIVELGSKTKAAETEHGIVDLFIEVYLSDKKKWRPVDIEEFAVMTDPHELTPHLDQPVACLIGIDNNGCMVDLSPKYNADWLDKMKHLRSDAKFFNEILARYAPAESEQAEEQQEVEELHEQQGLPKIISQFKNHPKYALARHLLKFEAFYPREPPILGYVRNEPVHPRECVHTLRSKDTWHRSARQVKEGELPYSIVKARPKWNKQTESMIKDLPLEVYGEWQTEPFQPPVAENGIIPRNKFGNVELFHPDMLPIGTVHLKLPGLQRIATELEVDCVPAVIGFDGVGRGCHPVLEGFVVCVENQELLEEAWNERQREDRHKRRERIRKRAVKNWKKLIRKVVWDLRLKRKYKNKLEEE